jgi:hypothetical protein
MNTKILLSVLLSFALLMAACKKDDASPAKPVIEIHELGQGDTHGNDHTAIIGSDIHIDVDVVAEGKISTIQVIIHPEGEHHDKGLLDDGHEEWEVDTTYTKFEGLKNTEFHEHIDVDIHAEPGDYHFDFIVTDMEGNQSSAEAELVIQAPSDAVFPEISITSAPTSNETFNNGENYQYFWYS